MKNFKALGLYAVAAGLCVTGAARGANIPIGDGSSRFLITTSQTWTADNVYNLRGQVYVAPGASLTIEPGTLIKSNPADQGSLCICRGAKIYANGTATNPIIFTSTNDNLTTPRHAAGEWGNITILGNGYISASYKNDNTTPNQYKEGTTDVAPFGTVSTHNNTATFSTITDMNRTTMEGLVAEADGDPRVLYGGNNDDDDSGSLSYVSLRYGGKVIGQGNELNGLSMGGVGRETDVHHIDIWCNVDDGIETWGGTVNYKYISIWNAGDDNFDVDQGWRGKAQFGLLVQGWSQDLAPQADGTGGQGSGIGDNLFEIDGAERSDAQPVTTAVIYNFTCIGLPYIAGVNTGDQAIALRDEARVQFRNCIFMDVGEFLIKEERSETATGSWRYSIPGTLSFADVWTTAYTKSFDPTNPNSGGLNAAQLQALYPAQVDGNLMEIRDCVFFNNTHPNAYDSGAPAANNNGVGYDEIAILATENNVKEAGAGHMPIKAMTRDVVGFNFPNNPSFEEHDILTLDPRAANEATTSVGAAPADGFFTPVHYRGAFSPDVNWAKGWTAASAYGIFTAADSAANPPSTVSTMVSIVSFATVATKLYTVECSTDGKNWTPLVTISGDGSTKTLAGLGITVDPAKVYRAIAQ